MNLDLVGEALSRSKVQYLKAETIHCRRNKAYPQRYEELAARKVGFLAAPCTRTRLPPAVREM